MKRRTAIFLAALGTSMVASSAIGADIWSYCQSVGTADKPNRRLLDKAAEKEIREVLNEQQGILEWRCMDGSVYACVWFNGPICSKRAGLHDEDIERYCQQVVNEPSVPSYITGHSDPSIDWACKHGKAVITGGDFRTDRRGYPVEVWTRIIPGVRLK